MKKEKSRKERMADVKEMFKKKADKKIRNVEISPKSRKTRIRAKV